MGDSLAPDCFAAPLPMKIASPSRACGQCLGSHPSAHHHDRRLKLTTRWVSPIVIELPVGCRFRWLQVANLSPAYPLVVRIFIVNQPRKPRSVAVANRALLYERAAAENCRSESEPPGRRI